MQSRTAAANRSSASSKLRPRLSTQIDVMRPLLGSPLLDVILDGSVRAVPPATAPRIGPAPCPPSWSSRGDDGGPSTSAGGRFRRGFVRYTRRLSGPGRRNRGRSACRKRGGTGLMGLSRTRPSYEILSGDSADVYFARAETILEKEGRDPLVTMEVFTRQDAVLCGIDEARTCSATCSPRPTPRDPAGGARRRRRHRAEGDRAPDPRPLPPVRAVRDGVPGHARPVDRLGHGGPGVRRGRCAGSRDQLRGAPHPPGHHRRPRLRRDRRRLRRRLDAGRGAARRPRARPARCPIRWS